MGLKNTAGNHTTLQTKIHRDSSPNVAAHQLSSIFVFQYFTGRQIFQIQQLIFYGPLN